MLSCLDDRSTSRLERAIEIEFDRVQPVCVRCGIFGTDRRNSTHRTMCTHGATQKNQLIPCIVMRATLAQLLPLDVAGISCFEQLRSRSCC